MIAEAVWRGRILKRRMGGGGFGYDPVFFDPAIGKTGAEMHAEEKNAVSHRGKAFRQLKEMLRETLL
jgi:XTP/dITP diphosphohydrolase